MLRPSADPGVEDVPMPELAVAAQVKLPRANPAHRHPDLRQVRPAIHLPLAARGERLHPLRRQFLVGRHQLVEIGAGERPCHGELPRMKRQRGGGPGPDEFQEIAPPKAHSVMVRRPASAARLLTFRMLLCVHKIEAKRLRFMAELWFPAPVCQGFGFLPSQAGPAGS